MRVAFIVLAAITSATAAPKFMTYTNGAYSYSISYAPRLMKPLPVSGSGDGRRFESMSGKAEFVVFAGGIVDDTPESIAETAEQKCPNHHASYRIVRPGLVAASCLAGANIFYQKTLIRDGLITTFTAKYPSAERAAWDSIVSTMARSMTPAHTED